jgi:ERCC4-type nuclease
MKILIDTREQRPFNFASYGVDVETASLPCGDYSLPGALQSIIAFQVRYRVPFLWCGSRTAAEYTT